MQTILICGSGSMAAAMGQGLKAKNFAVRYVVRDLANTHAAAQDECISYEQADFKDAIVILAFKAPGFELIKERLNDAALVLSAAAAISASDLATLNAGYIARIMPNIAAAYGASATTIFTVKDQHKSQQASGDSAHEIACKIISAFGSCVQISSEEQFLAAMGINGCSLAWLALVADGLAIGAASGGVAHAQAKALAAASIKSAAILLEHTSSEQLIASVCSPGGVTLKGLNVLEAAAVRSAFAKAVIAAK